MSRKGIGYDYVNVGTDTTVMTAPGRFYGVCLIAKSTGAISAIFHDAATTATGTVIFAASAASTAGTPKVVMVEGGIACGTGLHLNVTCTTAADQVIVYYGGI